MRKKAIALLMAGCMVGSMVAPAGTVMAQESDLSGTKITFLNTKTEIQDYLEDMGAAFKEETGIEVEFYTNICMILAERNGLETEDPSMV